MWLASRKPLSVREHSRFPFLVSRLTLDFCYTFVHIPTTHLLLSVATHFTTLWHTFTRDMSYALTTHLSCCTLTWACPWLGQSLAIKTHMIVPKAQQRVKSASLIGSAEHRTCHASVKQYMAEMHHFTVDVHSRESSFEAPPTHPRSTRIQGLRRHSSLILLLARD